MIGKHRMHIRVMRMLLAGLTVLLADAAVPTSAHAQLPISYTFRVPVVKVVPNPCTTGFELITGHLDFAIKTTDSGLAGFGLTAQIASAGTGEDALPSGTLIMDGTQKPHYTYTYSTGFDASFLRRPADFAATLPITDYLVRGPAYPNESIIMTTVFEVVFTNGIPTAPVVQALNVTCK